MKNTSWAEMLVYRYELVGQVEKDGKVYSKYKRIPRFGSLFYIFAQAMKIAMVGILAVVLSHFIINSVMSEKMPPRQFLK